MRSVFVAVFAMVVGCSDSNPSTPQGNPPAPPVSTAMPPNLAAALPKTPDGRPILYQTSATFPSGLGVGMSYDESLDDPVVHWGQCLSRVLACYKTNPTGPIAGCIDQIERCADATGGKGCCPTACIDAFHAALPSAASEDAAVDATFVRGECVSGFQGVTP